MNEIIRLLRKVSKKFPVNKTINVLAVLSFLTVASWNWDAWWHVAIGFETPWSPPHFLVFIDIFVVTAGSLALYFNTNKILYKRVFQFACITIAAGSIDVVWHVLFGIEKIIQPSIIWSPPHVIGIGSTAIGLCCLVYDRILEFKKTSEPLTFLNIVLFSVSALTILMMLTVPLEPFGWHHLWNQYGALATVGVFTAFIMWITRQLPNTGIASLTMLGMVTFYGFISRQTGPGISLPPHAEPPQWLHFFALMPGVLWLDYTNLRKRSIWIMGPLLGMIAYFIYSLFWRFIESPIYPQPHSVGIQLIFIGAMGGLIGASILWVIEKRVKLQ